MVIINPPLAIYKHLAALSFMLAGTYIYDYYTVPAWVEYFSLH